MASSTIRPFSSMASSPFGATFSAFNSSRRFNSFDLTRVEMQSQTFGYNKSCKLIRREGNVISTKTVSNMSQGSTISSKESALEWVKRDNRRMLHVVYHVGDIDRTIKFYRECLGMKLLRKRDNTEERYTNAFLGYGPEDSHFVIELTYTIGTDDVYKSAEAVKVFGGKITREPGPLPDIDTKITACLDPDGWKTVLVDNVDFLKEL
ncbi:unnamed protein product [Lactuca virosa]|uniref:VOC domain-containing protein n=1 Tax=Lactuca virosa TaxID=75947 RepID=A0AAU9MDE8_9ASTR|nr:unnamed protein product [Lactuca virosa]